MYYKLCNIYSKPLNKKYQIWREKLSAQTGKNSSGLVNNILLKIFAVTYIAGEPISREKLVREEQRRVQDGDVVKKGDSLVDGIPAPHYILRVLGRREND